MTSQKFPVTHLAQVLCKYYLHFFRLIISSARVHSFYKFLIPIQYMKAV